MWQLLITAPLYRYNKCRRHAIEFVSFNEHVLAKQLMTNTISNELLYCVILDVAFMQDIGLS